MTTARQTQDWSFPNILRVTRLYNDCGSQVLVKFWNFSQALVKLEFHRTITIQSPDFSFLQSVTEHPVKMVQYTRDELSKSPWISSTLHHMEVGTLDDPVDEVYRDGESAKDA